MEITSDIFANLKSFPEPELQQEMLANGKVILANKGDVLNCRKNLVDSFILLNVHQSTLQMPCSDRLPVK